MDLHDFLRSRQSIRRFEPSPIPDEVLQRILTTATYAPSAHNRQPWRFAVLTRPESKARLSEAMAADFRRDLGRDGVANDELEARVERSRARLSSAPVAIVLCMDASSMDLYPDEQRADCERIMAIQSTANAGMCLLLAVHAEGLAAVWSCAPLFAPAAVRTTLRLPPTWKPQALFLIGRSADAPATRPRKPVPEIAIFE